MVIIVLALLFTAVAWHFLRSSREDAFSVAFLDVGQADATLFSFDDGQRMLVDCGRDRRVLDGLGRHMRFFERTIDILAVTHPDVDHFGGCIDVLKRFEVGHVWLSSMQAEDRQWQSFLDVAREVVLITSTQNVAMGSARVSLLYPQVDISESSTIKSNDRSLVMRVQGPFSVLLTGDAEEGLEQHLVDVYGGKLASDILQVGHHGSNSSSIEPFVSAVSPVVSVISSGKDNRYGHPTRRVLARLRRASSTIFRTDKQGDIMCSQGDMHTPWCRSAKNLIY